LGWLPRASPWQATPSPFFRAVPDLIREGGHSNRTFPERGTGKFGFNLRFPPKNPCAANALFDGVFQSAKIAIQFARACRKPLPRRKKRFLRRRANARSATCLRCRHLRTPILLPPNNGKWEAQAARSIRANGMALMRAGAIEQRKNRC